MWAMGSVIILHFFFLISFFGWMQLIMGGVFIIYIRHYHNVIYIYMSCHFYQKKDICHVIIVMLPIRIVAAGLKGKLVTLLHYMSSAQGRLPTAIGLDSNHKQSHLLPIHNHYLPSIFFFFFFSLWNNYCLLKYCVSFQICLVKIIIGSWFEGFFTEDMSEAKLKSNKLNIMNLVKNWAKELSLSEDFIKDLTGMLGSGIIKGVVER